MAKFNSKISLVLPTYEHLLCLRIYLMLYNIYKTLFRTNKTYFCYLITSIILVFYKTLITLLWKYSFIHKLLFNIFKNYWMFFSYNIFWNPSYNNINSSFTFNIIKKLLFLHIILIVFLFDAFPDVLIWLFKKIINFSAFKI